VLTARRNVLGAGEAVQHHDEGSAGRLEPAHVEVDNHAVLDKQRPQEVPAQALVLPVQKQGRADDGRGVRKVLPP